MYASYAHMHQIRTRLVFSSGPRLPIKSTVSSQVNLVAEHVSVTWPRMMYCVRTFTVANQWSIKPTGIIDMHYRMHTALNMPPSADAGNGTLNSSASRCLRPTSSEGGLKKKKKKKARHKKTTRNKKRRCLRLVRLISFSAWLPGAGSALSITAHLRSAPLTSRYRIFAPWRPPTQLPLATIVSPLPTHRRQSTVRSPRKIFVVPIFDTKVLLSPAVCCTIVCT